MAEITSKLIQQKIVEIAKTQVASPPSNQRSYYTNHSTGMDKYGLYSSKVTGAEWCTSFADWCYIKAFEELLPNDKKSLATKYAALLTCQPIAGSDGASSTAAFRYFKKSGYGKGPNSTIGTYYFSSFESPSLEYFKANKDSLFGAKVFIGWGPRFNLCHTGILTDVRNSGYVETIEGNTGSFPGTLTYRKGTTGYADKTSWGRIVGVGLFNWKAVLDEAKKDGIEFSEDNSSTIQTGGLYVGKEYTIPYVYFNGDWHKVDSYVYSSTWKTSEK